MTSVYAQNAGLGIEYLGDPEDEFEQTQMMCSYEYGEWDCEEED